MLEFSCQLGDGDSELVETALSELESCAWTVVNERPHDPFFLRGYFETEAEAEASIGELRSMVPSLPDEFDRSDVDDTDWQNAYKAFLKPWQVHDLHWVPSWQREEYPVPHGHTALYFDAGMAFGTGAHETTRLMGRRLIEFRNARGIDGCVIDAGCGSGILALSAAKLGFRSVFGFDRDPEAFTTSRDNAIENGLNADAVHFAMCGLEEGLAGRQADLLLANIISEVLEIHAETLLRAVAPKGLLAMSGILASEGQRVRNSFEKASDGLAIPFQWIGSEVDGDWCDCVFQRI